MHAAISCVKEFDKALSPSELETELNDATAAFPGCALFLLFTGEKENGKSWCPDCTRAEPIILSALEEYKPESILLVFNVKRTEFRTPEYTYKSNPTVKISSVPTFQRIENGICVKSLGDSEAQDMNKVKIVVTETHSS